MGKHIFLMMSAIILSPALVWADAPPTTTPTISVNSANIPAIPASTAPSDKHRFYGFDVSGYADGSYNYLLRSNRFVSGNFDREYDIEPNGFTLQQVGLTIAKQPTQGFGGLLNFILGRDANAIAPYGMNPNVGVQNVGFIVNQAFFQYAIGASTLRAGDFLSLTGAEAIDPTQNTNFSRSILDLYAEPGVLLGVRETYVLNNSYVFYVGLNNGWDNIRDMSRRKTMEFGMNYTPNETVSLLADIYSGIERATPMVSSGPVGRRNSLDLVATWNVNAKLTLIGSYDYVMQTQVALPSGVIARAGWQGVAGYVNYQWNDTWRTSVRGEVFSDQDGYATGVRQNWREVTMTVGYTVLKNLEVRAETRHDFSNVSSFLDKDGVVTSNNQQSFGLEAVYKI